MEEEKQSILEIEERTSKDQLRLKEIDAELATLKQFLDDAKFHRQAIKKEIGIIT